MLLDYSHILLEIYLPYLYVRCLIIVYYSVFFTYRTPMSLLNFYFYENPLLPTFRNLRLYFPNLTTVPLCILSVNSVKRTLNSRYRTSMYVDRLFSQLHLYLPTVPLCRFHLFFNCSFCF